MNRRISVLMLLLAGMLSAQQELRQGLEKSYGAWRNAIIARDGDAWRNATAPHRAMEVKNRILSEKKAFPAAVFDLPSMPPALDGLKFLEVKRNGATATAYYFGKVNFGTGEDLGDNLYVVSFVGSGETWRYDRAEFLHLGVMPEVRQQITAGNLDYIHNAPELQPTGVVPPTPVEIGPVAYIAKVYVFGPGRDIKVQVNTSQHHFVDTKQAEVVIGGAKDGMNTVQYSIKAIPGSDNKEPLTIRVYLMSQVAGVQPIKVSEYQVLENKPVVAFGKAEFEVTAAIRNQLMGKH